MEIIKKAILCILSISQFQCKAAIVSYLNMFSWRCKPNVFLIYFVTIIATHFTHKSHELYATSENWNRECLNYSAMGPWELEKDDRYFLVTRETDNEKLDKQFSFSLPLLGSELHKPYIIGIRRRGYCVLYYTTLLYKSSRSLESRYYNFLKQTLTLLTEIRISILSFVPSTYTS